MFRWTDFEGMGRTELFGAADTPMSPGYSHHYGEAFRPSGYPALGTAQRQDCSAMSETITSYAGPLILACVLGLTESFDLAAQPSTCRAKKGCDDQDPRC